MNDSKVISIRLQGWIARSMDDEATKYGLNRTEFITGIYLGWLELQNDKSKLLSNEWEGWTPSEKELTSGNESD